MQQQDVQSGPRRSLSVIDAVAIVIGVVIGAGIFKTPSLVAAQSESGYVFLGLWLLGGLVSLIGAFCYAELAATYPHVGGEYHFLTRAFGLGPGFLFSWARLSVIQTGSIAVQAFVVGDYASSLLRLGEHSSAVYAMLAVVVLTALNISGLRISKSVQNALSLMLVVGLLAVVMAGMAMVPQSPEAAVATVAAADGRAAGGSLGLAMVFVLLTYGGWNEAAYLSTEVKGGGRRIVLVLLLSIGLITGIYLLVNVGLVMGLGLEQMAKSQAVAAELLNRAMGPGGAAVISGIVVVAALSTMNATIITGARSSYAAARDHELGRIGEWADHRQSPIHAMLLQGAIAASLIFLGAVTRNGFVAMVEYTAPAFWFFFLLVGISLLVLRRRDADRPRPFRVPLYPLTPLLFCAACVYMLRASLLYTGIGAWVGVAVILAGLPLLWLAKSHASGVRRRAA